VNWLIDTHILIWWAEGNKKLSQKARKILEANDAALSVSVVSLWEIALKHEVGKLKMSVEQAEAFAAEYQVGLLPLMPQHSRQFPRISLPHPDPYDRMLVAQADATPMYFMTQDASLKELSPLVRVFS